MKKIGAIEICEDVTVKDVVTIFGGGILLTILFYICTVGVFLPID